MKKNQKNLVVIFIGILFCTVLGYTCVFANAGSEMDPVVTLSFVEQKIEQLKYYVDSKVENKDINISENNAKLVVLQLKIGEKLIGESGTEMILRSGKAKAIGNDNGGLCDITAGKDIADKTLIETNHLLLIPRSDQRGMQAQTGIYVMVRGSYQIVQ